MKIKQKKFKEYFKAMRKLTLLPKKGIVEFQNLDGKYSPIKPWPHRFLVTEEVVAQDCVVFTKLTFINLARVIAQNFITMNWLRFKMLLHWIGFLETPPGYSLDFSWFRWDFWNVRKGRKLAKNIELEMKIKQRNKTSSERIADLIKSVNEKNKFEGRKN